MIECGWFKMLWQDIVITIASMFLSISLIPQVYHGFKKKVGPIKPLTSVPSSIGVYVLGIVFCTLSLYLSAIVSFITGSLWLILFIQRMIYGKD